MIKISLRAVLYSVLYTRGRIYCKLKPFRFWYDCRNWFIVVAENLLILFMILLETLRLQNYCTYDDKLLHIPGLKRQLSQRLTTISVKSSQLSLKVLRSWPRFLQVSLSRLQVSRSASSPRQSGLVVLSLKCSDSFFSLRLCNSPSCSWRSLQSHVKNQQNL